MVDFTAGGDSPGCGASSRACKTIRAGVRGAHAMVGERTVCVKNGVYDRECMGGGINISKTMEIKAYEPYVPLSVTVNCRYQGPAFRFQPAADSDNGLLRLTGIAVENGLSHNSGAAIAASGGTLVVENCHFENCTSLANGNMGGDTFYTGGGGGVFTRNMRSVALRNSSFAFCAAPNGAGGAVLVQIKEQKGVFSPGSNIQGGEVRRFFISSCNFADSIAGFAGGAIALVSNKSIAVDIDLRMENTNITNSKVGNSEGGSVFGGGLHVGFAGQAEKVNVTLQRCNIKNSVLNCTGTATQACLAAGGGVNVRYNSAATEIHTSFVGKSQWGW